MARHMLMVTKPFAITIKGGIAYIHLESGRARYDAAMPIGMLIESHDDIGRAINRWHSRKTTVAPIRPHKTR